MLRVSSAIRNTRIIKGSQVIIRDYRKVSPSITMFLATLARKEVEIGTLLGGNIADFLLKHLAHVTRLKAPFLTRFKTEEQHVISKDTVHVSTMLMV